MKNILKNKCCVAGQVSYYMLVFELNTEEHSLHNLWHIKLLLQENAAKNPL